MKSQYIQDICEYLIEDKGLTGKASRVIIQKVIFLSIYGKNGMKNIEPEVCAKMNGPYMNDVAAAYKKRDMFGNKKEILPDEVKSVVDKYYTLVSEETGGKEYSEVLVAACQSVYYYHCYMSENTTYRRDKCYSEAARLEDLLKYNINPSSDESRSLEAFRNVKTKQGESHFLNYSLKQLFLLREEEIGLEMFYELTEPDYFIPLENLTHN